MSNRSRRSHHSSLPRMENLEPRLMLTTYVVPDTIAHAGEPDPVVLDGAGRIILDSPHTDALQAFIDSVPDGTAGNPNVIQFQPNGDYVYELLLYVAGRHYLTFDGNGSHFEARTWLYPADWPNPGDPADPHVRDRSQWRVTSGSTDITITNMEISDPYPTGWIFQTEREAQTGIWIEGASQRVTVDSVHVHNEFGDSIYIAGNATDVVVQNSQMEHMGRQGLSVCANSNVLLYNNTLDDAQRSMIDVEPAADTWSIDHLRIVGNTFGTCKNFLISAGNISALYFANNTIVGPVGISEFGIVGRPDLGPLGHQGPVVMMNNTFYASSTSNLINVLNINGSVAMGNKRFWLAGQPGGGFTMAGGAGAIYGNNRFVDANSTGGMTDDVKDVLKWDNTIGDSNWTSSTVVTELADAYYFTAPYSDAKIQNGSVVGLMRKASGSAPITYNSLTFTGDLAVALLDANGDMVSGWVTDGDPARKGMGTASYKGVALPILAIIPTVVTQPASQNVVSGQAVAFSVLAGGSGPLAYQWKKNGAIIADATSNAYSFTAASGDNQAQFTCTVTNNYGAVTTTAATLTVSAAAVPTITTSPANISVGSGYTATFTVAASGPGPLSYQWQKNSVNITGATATTYVTPVTMLGDNGASYRCVVTNASGSTNSTAATLTVSTLANPTEIWTAGNGSNWPAQWIIVNNVNNVITVQSNQGEIKCGPTGGPSVAALDPATSSMDAIIDSVQQVDLYVTMLTSGTTSGLVARRADANPTLYYRAVLDPDNGGQFEILRGSTILTQKAYGFGAGWQNTYTMKLTVTSIDSNSTSLEAKVWVAGQNESTATVLTFTDTDPALQGVAGRVGIYGSVTVSAGRLWRYDNYSCTPSAVVPSAASNLVVTALSASHTRLTWQDNSGNESGFIIQRSTDGSTFSDLTYVDHNVTAYTDTGLTSNTRYYYRIRAYNTLGFGADSSTVRVTTLDAASTALAEAWTGANGDAWAEKWAFEGNTSMVTTKDIQSSAGRILCASGASGGMIAYLTPYQAEGIDQTVTFHTDGNGAGMGLIARRTDTDIDSYYFVRASAGDSNIHFYKMVDGVTTELASIAFGSTIQASTDYKVRFLCQTNGAATDLKAKLWLASGGEPGSWSAAISDAEPSLQGVVGRFGLRYELADSRTITTDNYSASFTATSSTISGLTATVASATQINLSWTDNSSTETGYRIDRSSTMQGPWATVTTTAAGATSYSDTGLWPSTMYYYRVTAVNAGGTDAYQPVATAYTTDITDALRESFTAQDGSPWPSKWTVPQSWAGGTFSIVNGRGSVNCTGTSTTVVYINTDTAVDTNQLGTFSESNNGAYFGFASRTIVGQNTFYYATANGSAVQLYKMVSGTSTQLGSTYTIPGGMVYGILYKMRMLTQTNGTNKTDLKVKVWKATDAEPGTWGITVTGDSTSQLQNVDGAYGFYFNSCSGRTLTADDYSCSSGIYLNAPAAPTGLSATAASPSQVNLAWTDASNNESSFVIEQSPDGSTNWTQIGTATPGSTGFSVTGLTANTAYYYRVKASNGSGDSAYTANATATTMIALPGAPTGLSATAAAYNQVALLWTDNATNETGFKIERSDDGGFTWNQIDTVGANITSYTSAGLTHDSTYHYRVRAYNGSGNSLYTTIVNVKTLAQITETWTGTNGAAWPSQWTVGSGGSTATIQGNTGYVAYSTSSTGASANLTNVNWTNSETVVSVKGNTNNSYIGVTARAGGNSCYRLYSQVGYNHAVHLQKVVSGVVTDLGEVPFAPSNNIMVANTWYKVKLRVETISNVTWVRTKVWLLTDQEPASWSKEVSDTNNPITSSGSVGLLLMEGQSGRYSYYDDLTTSQLA